MTQSGSSHLSSKKRILVAEDEFFIAMELTSILEKAGYHVIASVVAVDEALDLLKREHPDAVILTAMGVPFILVTALNDSEISQNSVLRGAD